MKKKDTVNHKIYWSIIALLIFGAIILSIEQAKIKRGKDEEKWSS